MRLLGTTLGVVLATASCVRQKSSTPAGAPRDTADHVCPAGTEPHAVGSSGGVVCANDREIAGPFPLAQVNECQAIAGSTSAARSACEGRRWLRRFALDLRGTGRCPKGTQLDSLTNLCTEEAPGREPAVFGPFQKNVVDKCRKAAAPSTLCGELRWERKAVLEWLGVTIPQEIPKAPSDHTRKFPWPEGAPPPQFVVLSFDGVGDAEDVRGLRGVARSTGARFTHFLSGVYFLYAETAHNYTTPRARRGLSDIGFNFASNDLSGPRAIEGLLAELNAAFDEGDEIATHFNGHFCGPGGVESWNTADWSQEIGEFLKLVLNSHRINGFSTEPRFSARDIRGARTPCHEGSPKALLPALQSAGFGYEASTVGNRDDWPVKEQGVWRMPLARIAVDPGKNTVLAQDFHLCHHFNNCEPLTDARAIRQIEDRALQAYLAYYKENFAGNRAPVHIGHHSTPWHGGAYRNAMARFAADVCRKPDTHCVTYQELVAFLETFGGRLPQHSAATPPALSSPGFDRHVARSLAH